MRRPTRTEVAAAHDHTLADVAGPGLRVLFVGINPSLYSAAAGRHFARPGNRFWPTLAAAGFTPPDFTLDEQQALVGLGLGITNLVPRATARADELTDEELRAGALALRQKAARLAPTYVAFLGVTAYRTAFAERRTVMGPVADVGGARGWVLPNPSGLNAHYQLPDLATAYGELRVAAGLPAAAG